MWWPKCRTDRSMAPICGAAVAYPTRAIGTSGRPSVLCISTCPAARQETNNPEERPDEIWLALPPGDGSQPEFATTSNSHTHGRFLMLGSIGYRGDRFGGRQESPKRGAVRIERRFPRCASDSLHLGVRRRTSSHEERHRQFPGELRRISAAGDSAEPKYRSVRSSLAPDASVGNGDRRCPHVVVQERR